VQLIGCFAVVTTFVLLVLVQVAFVHVFFSILFDEEEVLVVHHRFIFAQDIHRLTAVQCHRQGRRQWDSNVSIIRVVAAAGGSGSAPQTLFEGLDLFSQH